MDEEIGSVMMDVEEELVMPEIPVRPCSTTKPWMRQDFLMKKYELSTC